MIPLSVLDLVPVREGGTLGEAYAAAADLAMAAERLGYKRYWVAEHHAMEGIGGGGASVVLAHIGNATATTAGVDPIAVQALVLSGAVGRTRIDHAIEDK